MNLRQVRARQRRAFFLIAAIWILIMCAVAIHGAVAASAAPNGAVTCTGLATDWTNNKCPDLNEEIANLDRQGIRILSSVSGTNTITANASPYALTAYSDGLTFRLKPANDNTSTVTLNINALGAKAIVKQSGTALASGDLDDATIYLIQYFGSDDHFRVMGAVGTPGVDDDIPEIGDLGVIDTSAELRSLLTDETGTGAAMFGLTTSMADDLGCTASQIVRRNAGDTAFECATGAGGLASTDIDTSAELRAIMTDELGTGVLFFLGAPAADDQVFVSTSVSAGAWGSIPDSDGATQKLQYDVTTNAFSAGTDDDVPEAGDFGALSATAPITQSGGTISTSIATGRLVGRTTASAGVMEEITPDATLSLAAGALSVVDVTCTGCLGATEIAGLDAGDTTTGSFADARVDGSLEADEVNPTLGTQTQGNYQSGNTAGTGIAITQTPAEGFSATVALDFSDAGADPALSADQCRFTSNATASRFIVCEGDTADAFESGIFFTDPTADRLMTVPNADSNPVQPLTCTGSDKVSAISAAGVITCTADAGAGGGISNVVEDLTPQLGGPLDTNGQAIEFGTAQTDTSVVRSGAGDISIEGNVVYRAGGTDVAVADGGTGASSLNDLIALTTHTTGNYVQQVADGTGVDGSVNSEGGTYTPTLDLTELNTFTLGAGSATGIIFDAGATDPAIEVASGSITIDIGGTNELVLNATNLTPGANDGNALGASGTAWADLFLASGGLIEFDGGTTNTLTCTSGNCTIEGNGIYRAGGTDVAIADGGTGASDAATAFGNLKQAASETATGVVEMATTAEAETGTDTTRAVTAAGVKAANDGKHTFYTPAASMVTETTTGCAAGSTETATNLVMIPSKDCDGATQEGVQFVVGMPKSSDEGTLTARVDWTAASGSGDVIWLLSCLARSNDDATDTAFGTEVSVTDTVLTALDVHSAPESGAITPGGTWAENDVLWCRVQRDADAAGDTLNAIDAKIIGVRWLYTVNSHTDD